MFLLKWGQNKKDHCYSLLLKIRYVLESFFFLLISDSVLASGLIVCLFVTLLGAKI